jgi:hypothetical protein
VKSLLASAIGLLALCACGGAPQTKEAVRQAIIDHLAKRSDMVVSSMDIDVASVSFRQNEADAVVSFRPKGSASGGMQMNYTLERQGREWIVKTKKESGGSPHGAAPQPAGDLPPGHPPVPNPPTGKK